MNRTGSFSLVVLAAVGGAAAMYFLDPVQGRRRRAQVRDKAHSVAHHSAESLNDTSRHLRNKVYGMGAELKRMVKGPRHHARETHPVVETTHAGS